MTTPNPDGTTPAPAPAPAPASAPSGADASALAAGAAAAGGGNALLGATAPDPLAWLPEKHRVMGADGSLDIEASARKNAEAYSALEKRLGAGGVPPSSPGEYKIEAPEALKDAFQPEDPGFKEFLTDFHKGGGTQAQLDATMAAFFKWAPKVLGEAQALSSDECNEALSKAWGSAGTPATPEQMTAQYRGAVRAIEAFGGERARTIAEKFGNDPDVIWLMANVGKELQEDRSPGGALPPGAVAGESSSSLMQHPAFSDARHPEHAAISARWQAAVARETAAKQRQ